MTGLAGDRGCRMNPGHNRRTGGAISGVDSRCWQRARSFKEQSVKSVAASAGIFLIFLVSLPAMAQKEQGARRSGGGPRPMPAQVAPAHEPGGQNLGPRRGGRMTPEERQKLRRDVQDHGRDVYRDRSGASRP